MPARGILSRLRAYPWIAASVLLVSSIAVLASCSSKVTTVPVVTGPTIHIVMSAMNLGAGAFTPNPDTVSINSTVTWKNDDGILHTVTSNTAGQFDLSVPGGAQANHKFATAGSFPYHCKVFGHTMTGTVVVTP